jgi:hypothetical protein
VGPKSADEILKLVEMRRKQGITLSTVGFGRGNYKDAMMERLADAGDGNYSYIGSESENPPRQPIRPDLSARRRGDAGPRRERQQARACGAPGLGSEGARASFEPRRLEATSLHRRIGDRSVSNDVAIATLVGTQNVAKLAQFFVAEPPRGARVLCRLAGRRHVNCEEGPR